MEESEKASSGDLVDLPNEIQASRFVEARLKEIDALQQVCSIKGNNLCQLCSGDVGPVTKRANLR